jgi:glycosyltransferase involved in cell wall biosynthesis
LIEERFKVTVFIPTYNRLELLKNSVRSVLEQGDFIKVHILDNASSDGTQSWLEELSGREKGRVELTLRTENIGALANFAEGFSKVTTPYCVPLADDDELLPDFLQKALEIAERNPGIGGVVFQAQVKKNGEILYLSPAKNISGLVESVEHLTKWCSEGHYFSWSSILWNTELLHAINAKDEFQKHGFFGDAWIQFLAFSRSPFYLADSPGAVLNIHDGQASQQFGAAFVEDMASIWNAVKDALDQRKDLDQSVSNHLIDKLFQNWNKMIQGQCWNLNPELHKDKISAILHAYVRHFGGERFIGSFGLLPLFSEYRNEFDRNKNLENELSLKKTEIQRLANHLESVQSQLSWMQKSLSWRITMPLRTIATLLHR